MAISHMTFNTKFLSIGAEAETYVRLLLAALYRARLCADQSVRQSYILDIAPVAFSGVQEDATLLRHVLMGI